jgi:hypothetical protein
LQEVGKLGAEVAWRSMNSCGPLMVVLENEIGEPLRTHGVTVQANDYRSAPLMVDNTVNPYSKQNKASKPRGYRAAQVLRKRQTLTY